MPFLSLDICPSHLKCASTSTFIPIRPNIKRLISQLPGPNFLYNSILVNMESPQSRPYPPATPVQPAWITNLEFLAEHYDNEAYARGITPPPNTPINLSTHEELERNVAYLFTRSFGLDESACVPITHAPASGPSVLVTSGPEWSPPITLPYRPHADDPFPTQEEWSYTRYPNTLSQHHNLSPPANPHHSASPPASPPNPPQAHTPLTNLSASKTLWYTRIKTLSIDLYLAQEVTRVQSNTFLNYFLPSFQLGVLRPDIEALLLEVRLWLAVRERGWGLALPVGEATSDMRRAGDVTGDESGKISVWDEDENVMAERLVRVRALIEACRQWMMVRDWHVSEWI